jgi:hypothetical protein
MMGEFQITDEFGSDRTPRGAKARGLIALLCQTPGHRRPRRWLESRLWSDRGAEQASGSLRQALTELRRALGPLAAHLTSNRDCIALTGVTTDLKDDPAAARMALAQGREFLEGLDVMDAAFSAWLAEERQRVVALFQQTAEVSQLTDAPISLRLAALPQGADPDCVRDLGAAIARLTAEYLLRRLGEAEHGWVPQGLDLQLEGAWSVDRAHFRVRLVAQDSQKTLWSQRLVASRIGDRVPSVIFETVEAA